MHLRLYSRKQLVLQLVDSLCWNCYPADGRKADANLCSTYYPHSYRDDSRSSGRQGHPHHHHQAGEAMTARKVPQVPAPGGGTRERDRNKDGSWREKRSDTGKKRK